MSVSKRSCTALESAVLHLAVMLGVLFLVATLTGCDYEPCEEGQQQVCETQIATGIDPATGRLVTMPVTACVCVEVPS